MNVRLALQRISVAQLPEIILTPGCVNIRVTVPLLCPPPSSHEANGEGEGVGTT